MQVRLLSAITHLRVVLSDRRASGTLVAGLYANSCKQKEIVLHRFGSVAGQRWISALKSSQPFPVLSSVQSPRVRRICGGWSWLWRPERLHVVFSNARKMQGSVAARALLLRKEQHWTEESEARTTIFPALKKRLVRLTVAERRGTHFHCSWAWSLPVSVVISCRSKERYCQRCL